MSVITNSLAMMDTSSTITSLDADAVVYDNTTSGLTATDAQAAIDELKSDISNISTPDATDIAFTVPSASGHSTYGANTDTVQEALNDINDAMRSVVQYGTIKDNNGQYYIDARDTYYNPCGGIFGNIHAYTVNAALNWVNDMTSENIPLPSASKTGIYAYSDNIQEALNAIEIALDSGGGGAVDATDVTFDSDSGTWAGSCAGDVDVALRDLDERLSAVINYNWDTSRYEAASSVVGYVPVDGVLAEQNIDNVGDALEYLSTYIDNLPSGGGGNSTASSVSYTKSSEPTSIYGANTDTVKEALDDIDTVFRELVRYESNEYFIPSGFINYGPCYGILLNHNISTVSGALDYISTYLADGATNVSYTKPQSSIYGSNTDTVKEALDDVSTVIQALDSTDIAIPAASKTGIYANTATVQQALDAIKTAISSGGGGGSSSASSVSFTKPQGGIYSSGTDTVQEALEDVNYKIIYLKASDIGFLGSGCGGGYPTGVETVQDALNALEHLLYKYSEFEKETGLLWFNDKPIYQVSVEVESGTTNLFDTNELEIDDLVYMEATLTDSSGTKRWTISGSSGELYWDTATHMIVYGGSDVITTATIRYTKTSD